MFLDNLGQLKKVALFKYLEKGDFTGYDFLVEKSNIRNGKDLLEFLQLFVEYNCFEKNLEILKSFVTNIYENKSIIILYEAYLINTDPDIEGIIGGYSTIITKESFEFDGVNDLLSKSREIINNDGNKITIYNSVNNVLGFKDKDVYFNFLLELLETKNNGFFKEINLIFNLLIYTSNRTLAYQLKEISYFLLYEYEIEETLDDKYLYSTGCTLIKNFSDINIDYKNLFMKNMLNYLGKNEFYEEFFNNNVNIKLKELLFRAILGSLNKNNISLEEIKKDIKKSLVQDKRQLEKLVKDFRKDIEYIEDKEESSYADYIIDKI